MIKFYYGTKRHIDDNVLKTPALDQFDLEYGAIRMSTLRGEATNKALGNGYIRTYEFNGLRRVNTFVKKKEANEEIVRKVVRASPNLEKVLQEYASFDMLINIIMSRKLNEGVFNQVFDILFDNSEQSQQKFLEAMTQVGYHGYLRKINQPAMRNEDEHLIKYVLHLYTPAQLVYLGQEEVNSIF